MYDYLRYVLRVTTLTSQTPKQLPSIPIILKAPILIAWAIRLIHLTVKEGWFINNNVIDFF